MSEILTCQCGARIRVPESAQGRTFRCPRCKAELLATSNAGIITATLAHGTTVGAACPICQTAIGPAEAVVSCPECDQVHHKECWTEVGGCGTYGCKQAPSLNKPDEPADLPRSAWGDTKRCPACGETIKAIALRCRYCGTDFETVDPLTIRDLHSQAVKEESQQQARVTVIVLFVLSVIGCLAPLMLIVTTAYVLPKRRQIARAGPVYLILAYSSVVLSVLYSILMLLFWLFEP